MTRRAGLSLIEVLAALFIMGIGLISLFTLFPYGALQMASAVKDDRTAQCASAADAYMRVYWKERVLEPHPNSPQEPFFRQVFPQADAMDDPNADANGPGVPNANQKPPLPAAPGTPQVVPSVQGIIDPSYPLVVDPMGWVARAGRWPTRWR